MYPEVQLGDIVIKYRPKYKGIWKYLLQRLICFFTTEWWEGEPTSNTSHAEIVVQQLSHDSFQVFTEEPPKARFKSRSYRNRRIVRLAVKPTYFDNMVKSYIIRKMNVKYDYLKFLMFALDWLFRTTWFTRKIHLRNRDVCSESVAWLYKEIGIPCSTKHPDSTSPDDIYDATSKNPFIVVWDSKTMSVN